MIATKPVSQWLLLLTFGAELNFPLIVTSGGPQTAGPSRISSVSTSTLAHTGDRETGKGAKTWDRDRVLGDRTVSREKGQGTGRNDREYGDRTGYWETGQGTGRQDREQGDKTGY